MRKGIQFEDVQAAVAELTAAGQEPTIKAVRAALGNHGSYGTLVRMVRQVRAVAVADPVPADPLVAAIEAIRNGTWAELLSRARQEVAGEIEALGQTAAENAGAVDALLSETQAQEEVVAQLRSDLSATQAERTTALDALHVVAEIAAAVVAVQASVDQVASRLAEVEAGVERQVAGLGEQLSAGLASVQEQMAVDQLASAARSERDRTAVQASVVDHVAQLSSSISAQMDSLTSTQRSSFVATQKSIAQLSALTRMAAQNTKDYR